jgi:hypothetical protein
VDQEGQEEEHPLQKNLLECNNRELLSQEDLLQELQEALQAQEDSQDQEVDHHQDTHRIEVHHQVTHRIEDHHQAVKEGHLQQVPLITCLEIQIHFRNEAVHE